jgi:excisionase family DNA binding protein
MQPIALSIAEACAASHISRTRIYEAIREGELTARKHGRRTLILSADLHQWLQSLPAFEAGPRTHTLGE